MKVRLDQSLCQGAANCVAMAPEVFGYDEDINKGEILVAEPPKELREAVTAAEAGCPSRAIRIED